MINPIWPVFSYTGTNCQEIRHYVHDNVTIMFICHRFEYLQASSGKLVKPNVPPNHQWTGDKVQKLAGQGDIYIRPSYPFTVQVNFCKATILWKVCVLL